MNDQAVLEEGPRGGAAPRELAPRVVSSPGLLRRLILRESPRKVKVNAALRFYHEVLGLDHLHYGLWNGEPRNLEGLKAAQHRFSCHLREWIPDDVRSILDVGCGTGSTSLLLKEAGFRVEGLSPDPYHRDIFARRVAEPFHLRRFQEFEPPRIYDLVLMSESAQYIWLDRIFPAVRRSGAPGGYLLVADYFTVNGCHGALAKSGHPLDAFLERAEDCGLLLERSEDVTEAVAPTLALARSWLEAYVEPCLSMASDSLASRHPHVARLGRWLFRSRIAKMFELKRLVDCEEFRRNKRYFFLLFRLPRR